MRIWIDGYEANVSQRVGSGQVGFHLLRQIERLDKQNDYTVILASVPNADLPKEREGFRYKLIRPSRLKTWIGIPVALFSAKQKPDVFLSPTHYIPRFAPKGIKRVVMIFDLAFFHFQDLFTPKDFLQLKNWTGFSIKHADHIITISQSAKKEIEKYYDTSPEKITVAYPGFDNEVFKPINDPKKVRQLLDRYGISGNFVVFLGTIQPRKNIKKLIQSY